MLTLQAETTNRGSSISSIIFDSISLTSCDSTISGDNGDLVHYCTEFITLELRMLSVSGGLPNCAPIVRGKGAWTKHFGRRRGSGRTFTLHWDQAPRLPGKGLIIVEVDLGSTDQRFSYGLFVSVSVFFSPLCRCHFCRSLGPRSSPWVPSRN